MVFMDAYIDFPLCGWRRMWRWDKSTVMLGCNWGDIGKKKERIFFQKCTARQTTLDFRRQQICSKEIPVSKAKLTESLDDVSPTPCRLFAHDDWRWAAIFCCSLKGNAMTRDFFLQRYKKSPLHSSDEEDLSWLFNWTSWCRFVCKVNNNDKTGTTSGRDADLDHRGYAGIWLKGPLCKIGLDLWFLYL